MKVTFYFWTAVALFVLVYLFIHGLLSAAQSQADPFLVPLIALLSGLGLALVYTVKDPYRDTFAFFTQAKGVVFFGGIAFSLPFLRLIQRLPLHRYTYAYALGALVLLGLLLTLGHGPAGTRIELFGAEPIEFIKVLLVFFVAAYLAERRVTPGIKSRFGALPRNARDLLPLVAIYLFALTLFGAVKDLGPAVLLFGTFALMLYLVTGHAFYPGAAFLMLLIAAVIGDKLGIGFFATRVEMWLHPWSNGNRLGGQLAQGLWGMATGGIWGSGLGLGDPASVPRAGSDMVFTTLSEELGLVGGLVVLFVYSVIVFRGFQVARHALDEFDRLIAAGLTILLGLQALVITGGSTGLLPLTGITLPFIAYGSSSLVANFFAVGMLMRISAKSAAVSAAPAPSAAYLTAARGVAVGLAGALLIAVGVGRSVWLQGVTDTATATRPLSVPDADKVIRPHINPRLLAYAAGIPRGVIRDRNGVALATNAPPGHGISFLTGVPRLYPFGPVAANIVYAVEQPNADRNALGRDADLRGYGAPEALLPLYRRKDLPFPAHPAGKDVTLTLDIGLQKRAQQALEAAASRFGDGRGAAVVLDAKSGALLAAATCPTFDPNTLNDQTWNALHSGRLMDNPLQNRPFAGTYPPGSSFKVVTATAAFQQNKADLIFPCNHLLPNVHWRFDGKRYSRRRIVDDEEFQPHGVTDMAKAVRVSCNIYFAQLGLAVGADALERTIQDYQLNYCPSLERLGEDLPDCAYGQGTILVTPYQMAHVCQTVADGGTIQDPIFFTSEPQANTGTRILPAANARQIGEMMRGVVTSGTARGVFDGLPFSVAGKTGSAQLDQGKPHSWFVGYAPVDSPSVAFACIIEHGGHGRTAAAPVCRAILEKALR